MTMRLSIWRQFSSNHSSRYTVVGIFKSAEEVSKAVDWFMDLRQATVDWLNKPEQHDLLVRADFNEVLPATPPEREFAAKIGVPWDVSLYGDLFNSDWKGPFITFDNLLLVDGSESDLGVKPVDSILVKLGGQVYWGGTYSTSITEMTMPGEKEPQKYLEDDGVYANLTVTVTCTAPIEETAADIENSYSQYITNLKTPDGNRNYDELFNTPWKDYQPQYSLSSAEGMLRREGTNLTFDGMSFFHLADGFPAMIKYLREKQCSNIRYEFIQVNRGDH